MNVNVRAKVEAKVKVNVMVIVKVNFQWFDIQCAGALSLSVQQLFNLYLPYAIYALSVRELNFS